MQLQEFLQDLNARMSAAKTTGFWSEVDKKRWINKSIIRACNFAKWNFLNHHSTQLTEKDIEAYFNPFDYKPGGMMFIKVDGQEHAKTSVENYQSGNHVWERVFCILGDQYLIKPTPLEDSKLIDIYYRRRPIPLVNDTDEPITPEEARDSRTFFPPHVDGMSERPGMDILRERMDAVLGEVFAMDSGADSPFPDGTEWSWQVESGTLPRLVLSVDTIHAPVIRNRINDILRTLGLQQS